MLLKKSHPVRIKHLVFCLFFSYISTKEKEQKINLGSQSHHTDQSFLLRDMASSAEKDVGASVFTCKPTALNPNGI